MIRFFFKDVGPFKKGTAFDFDKEEEWRQIELQAGVPLDKCTREVHMKSDQYYNIASWINIWDSD